MKTEKVKLSQVKVNKANPRTIREAKLNLLVERMLVFPKMIAIRPVVVDNKMVVLGGNMRVTALNRIAGMTFEQLATIMGKTKKYQKWSQKWRERILSQWQDWLENPTVDIVEATELTEEEKKEFIIADNASFGEWDYDKLANEWEAEDLNSWGVDVVKSDAHLAYIISLLHQSRSLNAEVLLRRAINNQSKRVKLILLTLCWHNLNNIIQPLDWHHHRREVVVAILPLAQYIQTDIYLAICFNSHR